MVEGVSCKVDFKFKEHITTLKFDTNDVATKWIDSVADEQLTIDLVW